MKQTLVNLEPNLMAYKAPQTKLLQWGLNSFVESWDAASIQLPWAINYIATTKKPNLFILLKIQTTTNLSSSVGYMPLKKRDSA